MAARRSSSGFPPLTWARCECGCGWEGEDPVTQYLLEEAGLLLLDAAEARAESEAVEDAQRAERLREMAQRALSG